MECNKGEATRAKEISEKKFLSKDIAGAKKFALKAQNLYPDLEGISNMLATLDIYISAENKINGESDWYGILGVNPVADEQTIKKQYRKLALILHPDKNKSIGADGAFNLISEAWSFLSDKTKRYTYDQKRKARVFQQKVQPPPPPQPPRSNGTFNFNKNTTSNMKAPKSNNTTKASVNTAASASHKRKPDPATASSNKGQTGNIPSSAHKVNPISFWTMCHRCMMQHEYLKMYVNSNLVCPNCREPFLAVETTPPASSNGNLYTEWKNPVQQQQQQNTNSNNNQRPTSKGSSYPDVSTNNNQWGPFSKPANADSAVQAANMVKQTYNKVKREREEAQAATKREETLRRKRNDKKFDAAFKRDDMVNGVVKEANNAKQGKGDASTCGGPSDQPKSQDLMMEKARVVIRNQLNEWTEKKRDDASEEPVPGSSNKEDPISIDVPDPDFHDFDNDRTESCFGENQVWAAYDDDDGMPRYYAMIHNVISLDPFKMRISWLNSRTNNELGPLNWIESGFSKTCGDFRVGKREIRNLINSFSHKVVTWSKGNSGVIQVYPMKGDVWALYKNWSPEWNKLTEDEVIHKYEIVEVIEDYDEEVGVAVAPLVKVAGFKTVFHRHLDMRESRKIPRQEMFRFSHQIPSYLLTGEEATNAPKGCWELDPAATPSEFLMVIKEAESNENEENLKDENKLVDSDGGEVNVNHKQEKKYRKKGL